MCKILPLFVCLVLLSACGTKPVETTRIPSIETRDLRHASYKDFVTRRTMELEHIGGPYKNDGTAAQQANEEAKARFGDIQADWAQTTSPRDAKKAKEQAAFNDQLQKMQRRMAD